MKTSKGHMLVSDLSHRDPKDALHDIDGGSYLEAIDRLSVSHRQLMEDADMHIELKESNNRYRLTKIVKKREPEYIQGHDQYFLLDKEGHRIPIDEDQFDQMLGIQKNIEDVFESPDCEIIGMQHEYTCPRDVWDILFDATECTQRAELLMESYDWQQSAKLPEKWYQERYPLDVRGPVPGKPWYTWNKENLPEFATEMKRAQVAQNKAIALRKAQEGTKHVPSLKAGDIKWLSETYVYSANWYPYPADKRIHHPRAREIKEEILAGKYQTRQELSKAIGRISQDRRPVEAKKLKVQAKKAAKGKEKAAMFQRAATIMKYYRKDKKSRADAQSNQISSADRQKLWNLWRDQQMKEHGSIELLPWQYERALRNKLLRDKVKPEEVKTRVEAAMKRHLNSDKEQPLVVPKKTQEMPEWLLNVPLPDKSDVEDEYEEKDWLHYGNEVSYDEFFGEE